MQTVYLRVDAVHPEPEPIQTAAAFIMKEELVVFPTETVYGVGALAFSAAAVKKIFAAKDRPADQALLVHLSRVEQAADAALDIPSPALRLIERFWPGPLSIILPARDRLPGVVRGGLATVGLRMPSHPVARALMDITGPLAATSANLSGRPSPVRVEDVRADLDGRVRAVLDAGPTGSGLESTVLDLSGPNYRILRRGGVAAEALEEALGCSLEVFSQADSGRSRYQTRTAVRLSSDPEDFYEQLHKAMTDSGKVGIVFNDLQPPLALEAKVAESLQIYEIGFMHESTGLYTILRDAENRGLNVLLFAPLPEAGGLTASITDRIKAAAHDGA